MSMKMGHLKRIKLEAHLKLEAKLILKRMRLEAD